jgi:BirA family biotin operon repressor/biotin-[acetyl-CoA-carboxylase] ligase
MIQTPFLARLERFAIVGSTNDVIRGWLEEGVPEVCLAIADEQSAGRGREGRSWTAPAGKGLLLSLGFRPTWLRPDRVWRLAAVTSLAMAGAAEAVAELPPETIRLKWPNDLVAESSGEWLAGPSPSSGQWRRGAPPSSGQWRRGAPPSSGQWRRGAPPWTSEGSEIAQHSEVRKLAGVLGETDGLGTDRAWAIVGIGVNVDWSPEAYPPELAAGMTSLRELSGGRHVETGVLLDAFLPRLEAGIEKLRVGGFDATAWVNRQLTNGRLVLLEGHDGGAEVVRATGVDPDTGALIVADEAGDGGERAIVSGEIRHLRVSGRV